MAQNNNVTAVKRISVEIEVRVYSRASIEAIRHRVAIRQTRKRNLLQRLMALSQAREKK